MGSGRAPSPALHQPALCFSVTAVPQGWAGAWPSPFCTPVHRMSSGVEFVPFNPSALEQQRKFSHTASSRIPHEEVFNVGVWLFKLNDQPLAPSNPHQSRMQRPQNVSLVSLHCSPLRHSRAFLSPSPVSLASPRLLPSLWCPHWLHTQTPLHLCRGTADPHSRPGLGVGTGTPATGTRLYPKSGYSSAKGGRSGAA